MPNSTPEQELIDIVRDLRSRLSESQERLQSLKAEELMLSKKTRERTPELDSRVLILAALEKRYLSENNLEIRAKIHQLQQESLSLVESEVRLSQLPGLIQRELDLQQKYRDYLIECDGIANRQRVSIPQPTSYVESGHTSRTTVY